VGKVKFARVQSDSWNVNVADVEIFYAVGAEPFGKS